MHESFQKDDHFPKNYNYSPDCKVNGNKNIIPVLLFN
jgi:hypothetical protein